METRSQYHTPPRLVYCSPGWELMNYSVATHVTQQLSAGRDSLAFLMNSNWMSIGLESETLAVTTA
jgi:hypothetical protein